MTDKLEVVILDRPRYDELLEVESFLKDLRTAGLENWDGYWYVQAMRSDKDEKEIYE